MKPDQSIDTAPTAQPMDIEQFDISSRYVGLTVLFHPNTSRIGDLITLFRIGSDKEFRLSRIEPDFQTPNGTRALPLANPVLSRQPIIIQSPNKDMVRLSVGKTSMEVVANNKCISQTQEFSIEEVESGVVIELAKRVVLLLHLTTPYEPLKDDLGFIGYSTAIRLVRKEILRVADLNVPILLLGESGVGKELIARAIARVSQRHDKAYVAVNMAAIPDSIAAAELFGHTKGAFTNASTQRKGYFERADQGTLFLDEIANTSSEIQAMLLRVIEDKQIQMVGSESSKTVDVRLIAATDADLEQEIRNGNFRLALKQRLQEYEIYIPPLRVRKEDIGRLFIHFLKGQLERIGEEKRLSEPEVGAPTWLPPSLIARIVQGKWPGNVRQLRVLAHRIAIANRGDPGFHMNNAVESLLEEAGVPKESGSKPSSPTSIAKLQPWEVTEDTLRQALRRNQYRARTAADELGISATSIYTLIERFGIPTSKSLTKEQILQAFETARENIEVAAEMLEVPKRGLQLRIKDLGLDLPPKSKK